MWTAELLPLSATLFSFIFGLRHFFKQGKPLFLQSITMAMGCHSLGSIYQLCLMLTNMTAFEGFTPAYLGRIGFFLFFIAASYGHMDRIIDDGTPAARPSRYIALIAPVCAAVLYIPTVYMVDSPAAARITISTKAGIERSVLFRIFCYSFLSESAVSISRSVSSSESCRKDWHGNILFTYYI